MWDREDWVGYSGRIKRKSVSISFVMHCVGFFLLISPSWKRQAVEIQKIFTVQIVNLPAEKLHVENKEVVSEIKTSTEVPVKNGSSVKKEYQTRAPAKNSWKTTTEKQVISPFASESFREKLLSKIDSTDSLSQVNVSKNQPANKSQPVKIGKLESSLVEITTPDVNVNIPEWYLMFVQDKIKGNWKIYNILGKKTTTVSFRINRTGRISNISIEVSSGNTNFDKSVLDAVKMTQDLPHFPEEIKQPYLDIVIEFSTEGGL